MIARALCDLLEQEWRRLVTEWQQEPGLDTLLFLSGYRISQEATYWRKIWISELPPVKPEPLKRQYIGYWKRG